MKYHIFWALFGCISNLEIIVPFDSDDVAVCFRRNMVGVTNSSTRGGVITANPSRSQNSHKALTI